MVDCTAKTYYFATDFKTTSPTDRGTTVGSALYFINGGTITSSTNTYQNCYFAMDGAVYYL
jgi:hypothetical protein